MYLSIQEIGHRKEELEAAVASLLAIKALVGKPSAKQWRFFQDSVRLLFDFNYSSDLDGLPVVQASQLKFEVEDSFRRYYLRPGPPVRFVFTFVHGSRINEHGLEDSPNYPRLSGYCLLIREMTDNFSAGATNRSENLKPYLERVIAEAMDAEFAAYQALPELNVQPLSRWFCAESPAIKEILNLLLRHQKRGWVISNTMNPSTKRLLKVTVKKAEPAEAVLTTMEYWYLRWWDLSKAEYTYPYRETNRQMYILKKEPEGWKVFENLRPSPRTSVPHRRMQRHKKENAG